MISHVRLVILITSLPLSTLTGIAVQYHLPASTNSVAFVTWTTSSGESPLWAAGKPICCCRRLARSNKFAKHGAGETRSPYIQACDKRLCLRGGSSRGQDAVQRLVADSSRSQGSGLSCHVAGCQKAARFASLLEIKLEAVTGKPALRSCRDHKTEDQVATKAVGRLCRRVDCTKSAVYGVDSPIVCREHKLAMHTNHVALLCEHSACEKVASYAPPGSKKAKYCGVHRCEGHVNLRSKMCESDGCARQASYGDPDGGTRLKFCNAHRPGHFVNMKSRGCVQDTCRRQASYGPEGSKRAQYCAVHRRLSDVQIIRRKCQHPMGCLKNPSFGPARGTRPLYCAEHRPPHYIDVVHARCGFKGCGRQPCFGPPGLSAVACNTHRLPSHVDLVHRGRGGEADAPSAQGQTSESRTVLADLV